jgi:hypothetical protein
MAASRTFHFFQRAVLHQCSRMFHKQTRRLGTVLGTNPPFFLNSRQLNRSVYLTREKSLLDIIILKTAMFFVCRILVEIYTVNAKAFCGLLCSVSFEEHYLVGLFQLQLL